ncbi:AAA family ATPase [Deinococcus yavapaiensis]|uniref:AAA domain-containing protein n=1 Tax=Deinococcus yavapaiensis KR-236 TaxID=694435 RepID=A0A318S3Y8_9DEIO|nr:AAA family ATPase [Deinococcus yavapaiensis]PYE53255.1 AAA domain-containing protein [Deinococcus yavapaiensis KR-236]
MTDRLQEGTGWTGDAARSERRVRDVPVVVLVGVTGVGKSTVLGAMRDLGVPFTLLPDRRAVTDAVMIEPFVGAPVTDREERFRLTAAYRQAHPGGMAEALAALRVPNDAEVLLFDGLRGVNEVTHAARHLPLARFVALTAPDFVRVRRLLGRGDAFDAVEQADTAATAREALNAIADVRDVFDDETLDALARLDVDSADLAAKTRIVVTERRNYDPEATVRVLEGLPSERALILDTVRYDAREIARRVMEWL